MAPRALVRIVPWAGYEVLRQLVGRHLFCKNNLFLERPWVNGAGRHLFCKNYLFWRRPWVSGAGRHLFCKNYLFWRRPWASGAVRRGGPTRRVGRWVFLRFVLHFCVFSLGPCFCGLIPMVRVDSYVKCDVV